MNEHVVIIGGGLAGLSAGCYARASGFRTTIVEHNLALGGVCTSWNRGAYTIDGCIHWLTGGAFEALYRELGIVPAVPLRTIEHFASYRNVAEGFEIAITRDLDRLARDLASVSPSDAAEIARLVHAAVVVAGLDPGVAEPSELMHVKDGLVRVWGMRASLGTLVHYRKPAGEWVRAHLRGEPARRFFLSLVPAEAPMLFALMMLGYLSRGWLSRPVGGTASFRDALVASYEALGGETRVHATVDEILVSNGRARGVRLDDGTIIDADFVISTSSAPETVLCLLGGRYGADATRKRLERWKLFDPIVLVSVGAAIDLAGAPPMLLVDGVPPFDVHGATNERLYLRVGNDEPSFAPPGHVVVQAMLTTTYDGWAKLGDGYGAAKDAIAEEALARVDAHLPGVAREARVVDVATPLTYWTEARSWRGAYEGWMPRAESMFAHVERKLPGLEALYLAGQWVEPGGGVPMAVMSGRHAVQLLCADEDRPFAAPGPSARRAPGPGEAPRVSARPA